MWMTLTCKSPQLPVREAFEEALNSNAYLRFTTNPTGTSQCNFDVSRFKIESGEWIWAFGLHIINQLRSIEVSVRLTYPGRMTKPSKAIAIVQTPWVDISHEFNASKLGWGNAH